MSSTGSASLPNGTASGHLSHRPHTPAYNVGNQFVQQFYSVLHQSPEYLHRFYTDDSTVTHSDPGSANEPPSSVTVTCQKDIRARVAENNYREGRTEIWSVESQYSLNSGVLVTVTGTLEIKDKKKRDFVQTFFLATQEKGYYVLNDQFRYLREKPAATPQPKEAKFNNEPNAALQGGYYQPTQPSQGHLYYPQVQQQQVPLPGHHAPYQNPAPGVINHAAPVTTQSIGHNEATPATSQYEQPQAQTQNKSAPVAPPAPAAVDRPEPTETKPVEQAPPKPVSQPAPEAPKPIPIQPQPREQTAASPTPIPKEEPPKPVQASSEPVKAVQKEKDINSVASKSTQTPAPEPAKPSAEPQKPVERPPSGPLTYADRLKIGAASANGPKPTPSNNRPTQQPRAVPITQQRPSTSSAVPISAVKISEIPAATNGSEKPESQNEGNASAKEEDVVTTSIFVRNLPEEITQPKLEETFSRYGPIKGVSLRQQKGKVGSGYAFIDYEDQASMHAAIAAQTLIDDKPVQVMERKPLLPREARPFGGRGGRGEGRGFRGRNDGRGRGREGRPHTTGGRSEGRPDGGRGRGYEGRGNEGGRGRGDRGRGRFSGPQAGRQGPPPSSNPQPTPA